MSVKQTNSLMWSQKGQRLFVHLCQKHFKVSLVITAGWFSMYSDIQFLVSGLLELRKTRKVCSSAVTGCAVKSNWCTHRFISIDQNNNIKQANRTLWYVHSERDKSETVKQSFTVKVVFSSPPTAENHLLEPCSRVDFVQVNRTPPHLCMCSLRIKVSLFHPPKELFNVRICADVSWHIWRGDSDLVGVSPSWTGKHRSTLCGQTELLPLTNSSCYALGLIINPPQRRHHPCQVVLAPTPLPFPSNLASLVKTGSQHQRLTEQ